MDLESEAIMDKSHMSMILPKVGDKLFRIMSRSFYAPDEIYNPEPCTVSYVNKKNGWYEVVFDNTGLREGYRIPTFDHSILKGQKTNGIPILCLETGDVYPSMLECERDMGIWHSSIWRQINGERVYCNGYNFSLVL